MANIDDPDRGTKTINDPSGKSSDKTGKSGDSRTKWARIYGRDKDGSAKYDRIAKLDMSWQHVAGRWIAYLATVNKDVTDDKSDDTYVWCGHRANDKDASHRGSLGQVFCVPCGAHNYGEDVDGNKINRLEIGIDKAHFWHTNLDHGELAHIGPFPFIPPEYKIIHRVNMYFHRRTMKWRWYGTSPAFKVPKPTGPVPTPSPTPTPNPKPVPTGGGTTPVPTNPGTPAPTGGTSPYGPGPVDSGSGIPHYEPGYGIPASYPTTPSSPYGSGAGKATSTPGSKYSDNPGSTAYAQMQVDPGPNRAQQQRPAQVVANNVVPNNADVDNFDRAERPSRYRRGSPKQKNVSYKPARTSRYRRGTPRHVDQGELNPENTSPNWSDSAIASNKHSQDNYDAIAIINQLRDSWNNDNLLWDYLKDLYDLLVTHPTTYTEKKTVTILAGASTGTVTTTYAFTGAVPEFTGNSVNGLYIVSFDSHVTNGNGTRSATVRISDDAPIGGVEIGIHINYAK